jgi:hypothetical protein
MPVPKDAIKRKKSFRVARSGASTFFLRIRSHVAASSRTGSPF